jgi:Retrotransposon gag protein
MADDDAAAAAAALQGALGAHETTRRATDLPLFYGRSDKDVCTARQLIQRFETAAAIANWDDDERKCRQFSLILRGKALDWFTFLEIIPDFNLTNWDALKTQFLNAYAPKYTARATCTNVAELQQRVGESCQDFYLRAMDIYVKLKAQRGVELTNVRYVPAAGQAGAAGTHQRIKLEGIEDTSRFFMQQLFVAGLREDIREKVMERDPRTLQASLEEARAMELIVQDKRKKTQVTAVKEEEEEDNGEEYTEEEEALLEKVSAIFKRSGKNPGRFFNNKKRSFKPNPNITCRGCGKKGHIEKYCWAAKKKTNAIQDANDTEIEERLSVNSLSLNEYYGVNSIRANPLN